MQLHTPVFLVCWALTNPTGRFLTYVPPSQNINACTGGRCAGTEGGTLISTNYPANYPDKSDTTYILEANTGSTVRLVFTQFELEGPLRGECVHDYLKVLDSDDTTLATLCGSEVPKLLQSQSNKMTVKFYSDESENKQGFQAKWKAIENPTSGEFKSPNYPKNYKNREYVYQLLEAPKGSRIQINIVDFRIEKGYDFLTIDYGAKRPKVYTGKLKDLPETSLTSITNKIEFVFTSDYIITKRGF